MTRPRTPRLWRLLPILAAGILLGGCSTGEDADLFTDISTFRLLMVDSGIAPQSVEEPDGPYQAVTWAVGAGMAELQVVGAADAIDLTFQSSCDFRDTVLSNPVGLGECQDGIIIDSVTEPVMANIRVTVDLMDVRRARPVILPAMGDFDGDGFNNADDICPLINDPDQSDDNNDGIGDSCTFIDAFGGTLTLDNDQDGREDVFDNCVWIANPDQADTGALADDGIPDGIGDVCVEQIATVREAGTMSTSFTIDRMVEIAPETGGPSFITIDFRGADALSCDWDMLTCDLDTSQVQVCFETNLFLAGLGCF